MSKATDGLFKDKAGRVWPEWTPPDLLEWLGRLRHGILPFEPEVVFDPRMQQVWRWFQKCEFRDVPDKSETQLSLFRTTLSFCMEISRATQMPGKPGNMPPKERAAYLLKVQGHARALIELLEGTRFSSGDTGAEIDRDKIGETVARDLEPWGDDEMGHVVAYWVDQDATYKMPWDYPDNHLALLLGDLVEWTRHDDYFDRSIMRSSKTIGHANSRSARVIYFTCTLYEKMENVGLLIPFPILATIANVALRLSEDETLDEETARKQVRRYQAKQREVNGEDSQSGESDADPPF